MRVLIVVGDFPAISETFVLDQITGLIDRGFTVDILAARPRPEAMVHSDVEVYRLIERTHYTGWGADSRYRVLQSAKIILSQIAKGRIGLVIEMVRCGICRKLGKAVPVEPRQILAYARTLQALSTPDVVLCHFGPQGDMMIRVRKAMRAGWPVVTFFHGYDVSLLLKQVGPRLYDRLFREGDLHFPISNFIHSQLLRMGAVPGKTVVQRMGVRSGVFHQSSRKTTSEIGREFTFIMVGRLVEKKGQEYAVRAIALCYDRDPAVDIKLVMIGDGPLDAKLRQIKQELGIDSLVELRGSQTREGVAAALLAADGFLAPSVTGGDGDMEGIPVVISEAMSAGLPVISTRHAGIPEVVEDEITGILVAERDVEGLADAISRIARDQELATRLGDAGRDKIVSEFDIERWNDLLAERLVAIAKSAGGLSE